MKEQLKAYIVELVKRSTTSDKPYYFIKWSGLPDLVKSYGYDILKLIDELVVEGKLKKALIKGRLAVYLPNVNVNQKTKQLKKDFENFLKQLNQ